MRKFVINNGRNKTSIMEVECEKVTPLDDPSVMLLPFGEYKARIVLPVSFHEKREVGTVPAVWYSHSFFESVEAAKANVERTIRFTMVDFAKSKHKPVATEEEVQAALADVEVVML